MRLKVVVGLMEIARYDFPRAPGELTVQLVPRWPSWVPGLGVDIRGKLGNNNIRISIRT
jgi:hypothetical protein